ncbi:hypothetical protein SK128_012875 [Halocaridina rubra]|uniref:Cyclin-like domain-containing protein n=1 Tax=Halocaridina rubra TaxID=373956 RepID=A0AAN9A1M4_HALRR
MNFLRYDLRRCFLRQIAANTENTMLFLTEEVDIFGRESEVSWQGEVCGRLGWAYETRFTAAALLDRLIHLVRIPPRYLHAVAAAAVFLAAKIHEEDENVPSTLDVVNQGRMDCSHRELLRMERVLLDKLSWHPKSSFTLDFLQVLHALTIVTGPKNLYGSRSGSPTRQLCQLTERLWQVVCSGHSGRIRPSLLSLAVLSLDLDACSSEPGLTLWLQAVTQASDADLANARGLILDLLGDKATVPTLAPPSASHNQSVHRASPSRPNKRKVAQSMEQGDDLYMDIKKLYACDKISSLSEKVITECQDELEDMYYDIRRLYSSPLPIANNTPSSQMLASHTAVIKSSRSKKKKKTKPTFKAKAAVRSSLKQAFKIPCKISLITTKKIFEEQHEEEEEDMELDGEDWEGPLVEPVGVLKSPIFSPTSPEFPDIRHLIIKKEDICWQQHAQEVTEQVYRPLTYAQVLRLHLTPLTQALGV